MTLDKGHNDYVENVWRTYMESGDYEVERKMRQLFRLLPGHQRCPNAH